jgi:hypothetical protein
MMRRAEGATPQDSRPLGPGTSHTPQECECSRKRATTRLPDRSEAGPDQLEKDPGRSQAGPDRREAAPDRREARPGRPEAAPDRRVARPGRPEAAPDPREARPGAPGGRGGGQCWRPAGGPGCRRSPSWPLPTTTRRRPPWAATPAAAMRRGCACGRCCGRRSPPAGRWPTPKRHSPACRRGTTAGAKAVRAPSQHSGW